MKSYRISIDWRFSEGKNKTYGNIDMFTTPSHGWYLYNRNPNREEGMIKTLPTKYAPQIKLSDQQHEDITT